MDKQILQQTDRQILMNRDINKWKDRQRDRQRARYTDDILTTNENDKYKDSYRDRDANGIILGSDAIDTLRSLMFFLYVGIA